MNQKKINKKIAIILFGVVIVALILSLFIYKKAEQIYRLFYKWFITEEEKHRLIIDVWSNIKNRIEMWVKYSILAWNNLYSMIDSHACGSQNNITQICGMKWLIVNPQWEVVELPIKHSLSEAYP